MPGRVAELWRYPVKSLLGERLDRVDVAEDGITGDRIWGIRDLKSARILSAKQVPTLIDGRATTDGGAVVIALPGGVTVEAGDPRADSLLSGWIGRSVRLERAADAVADRSYEHRPHHFYDSAHVHVLSTTTLRTAGDLDLRRFRPNVVLDGLGDEGSPEEEWVGLDIALGDVVLHVRKPCDRCAMVTYAQDGLHADPLLLLRIREERDSNLGVLTEVVRPGTLTVGAHLTSP